jgi:hypothetical protein
MAHWRPASLAIATAPPPAAAEITRQKGWHAHRKAASLRPLGPFNDTENPWTSPKSRSCTTSPSAPQELGRGVASPSSIATARSACGSSRCHLGRDADPRPGARDAATNGDAFAHAPATAPARGRVDPGVSERGDRDRHRRLLALVEPRDAPEARSLPASPPASSRARTPPRSGLRSLSARLSARGRARLAARGGESRGDRRRARALGP